MIRVPRDDAKRGGGGRGRGRANWLARLDSGRGKNPAQPAELRDEKKETKAVESSMSKLQLGDDTPTSKKKRYRESKKKRYRESKKCHSQNQHCAVCLKDGHLQHLCPYRKRVPLGVTEVGKGYILICRTCGLVGNVCGHGRSYARFYRRAAALPHEYPTDEEVEQFMARQREMAEMSRARVERGEPSLWDDTDSNSPSVISSDSSSDSSSEI
ncbi:hypothetical protein D8674_010235 [Pyrus ussuriensis x Pyrus communis]|uniref:Uncharacterized protein n=1 Tax=Pyrus ussuriensis x Pyrus communis TaxID=2448454 RepID=A0A5N5FNW8_9ROSA|nr:uncharacterized protein LOC103952201 [Pyrus x bretschneideri]KAB2599964.1 hypothetical protein D8674_010235 [Pyrus ussuriensis x Pyrus communis]